jgi:hypothetical protein
MVSVGRAMTGKYEPEQRDFMREQARSSQGLAAAHPEVDLGDRIEGRSALQNHDCEL